MLSWTDMPNPVVKRTALRAYPGWTIARYADGTFCAFQTNGVAMSPVEQSFGDALYFVKHDTPVIH